MMHISPESNSSRLIVGLVAALAGTGILAIVPVQIPGESWQSISNVQSPAFFPILNALFLTGCGIALIVSALRAPDGLSGGDRQDAGILHPMTLGGAVALLIIYLAMISYVGMVVSSGIAIAAMSLLLGYRNKPVIAASAVVFPVVIYLLFEKLLKILLPHGVLF